MYALQKKSLRIKNHDGTVAEVPALLTHDEERLEAVEAAVTDEAATRAAEDLSLSSGIATLSSDLASTKKALKIEQRNVENLRALLKDTDYKDVTDRRELHSKTLGDAEVCGDDVQVLPNGELVSIGGRTVVWNQRTDERVRISDGNYSETDEYYELEAINIRNRFMLYFDNVNYPKLPSSHLFYYSGIFRQPDTNYTISQAYYSFGKNITIVDSVTKNSKNTWDRVSCIIKTNESGQGLFQFAIKDDSIQFPVTYQIKKKSFVIIDLTQMFGAGNEPESVDAFEALIDTSVYHPYNSGTLMSLPTKSVNIDGRNIFDVRNSIFESSRIITKNTDGSYTAQALFLYNGVTDTVENAKRNFPIDNKIVTFSADVICSRNEIYWGFYLADGTVQKGVLNIVPNQKTRLYITSTSKAVALRFSYANIETITISNMQIEEGSVSHPYSPKCRLTLVIPQSVRNRPGYGWSAGDAKNSIYWNEEGRLIERIEVGSVVIDATSNVNLDNVYDECGQFSLTPSASVKTVNTSTAPNIICTFCETRKWSGSWLQENADNIATQNGDKIRITTKKFTTLTSFMSYVADNPIYIKYELAEPIENDITDLITPQLDNLLTSLETGGTVTFVADGVDPSGTTVLTSDEQSLPVPNSITYQTKIAS